MEYESGRIYPKLVSPASLRHRQGAPCYVANSLAAARGVHLRIHLEGYSMGVVLKPQRRRGPPEYPLGVVHSCTPTNC